MPAKHGEFTASTNARYLHRLKNHRNSKDWLTIQQTAEELGVSQTVIRRLIREKKLPASQLTQTAPWVIARESLSAAPVQSETTAIREGRQLRHQAANQHEFPFK